MIWLLCLASFCLYLADLSHIVLTYVTLHLLRLHKPETCIFSVAGPGGYFGTVEGNPFGTSNGAAIALSLFSSPMIIAFLTSMILDNTAAGATREERGLTVWEKAR